jgi:hypothetical protein
VATGDDFGDVADSLPDLFARLWSMCHAAAARLSQAGWLISQHGDFPLILRALRENAGAGVPSLVLDYLLGQSGRLTGFNPPGDRLQRAMIVAQAIDAFMADLHPLRGSGRIPADSPLVAFREHRTLSGHFSRTPQVGVVVFRAPLRPGGERVQRTSDQALEFHFAHLQFVRTDSRARFAAFATSLGDVARAVRGVRSERVGFAPLAQAADELEFTPRKRGERCFLRVEPARDGVMAQRLIARARDAVAQAFDQGVTLLLFPEFCVNAAIISEVRTSLRDNALAWRRRGRRIRLALCVAGTGLTVQTADDVAPFARCVVLDSSGNVLWEQDKLHPYVMQPGALDDFSLPKVPGHETEPHTEDLMPGTVLEVRDLPGLGRALVLTCEDLQQTTPGLVVCEMLEPDWVFAPVLDGSIEAQKTNIKWEIRRACELAQRSRARIVVPNSMTLELRRARPAASIGIGLCTDDVTPRRFRIAAARSSASTPISTVLEVVDWEPTSWSALSATV